MRRGEENTYLEPASVQRLGLLALLFRGSNTALDGWVLTAMKKKYRASKVAARTIVEKARKVRIHPAWLDSEREGS